MPDSYVLDSYALLTYFNSEPAGAEVKRLLEAANEQQTALFLSQINLGEIYYIAYRRRGPDKAQEAIKTLRALPITLCEASEVRILAAAEIKAQHSVSYADAFGAALAQELRATLVTGDPEFKKLEPGLAVMWLP